MKNSIKEILESVGEDQGWDIKNRYDILIDFLENIGCDLDQFDQYVQERADAENSWLKE
jgi:hypothetical protein